MSDTLEHPTLPEAMYHVGTMWLPIVDKAAFVARLVEADVEKRKSILREAHQMADVSAANLDALINGLNLSA